MAAQYDNNSYDLIWETIRTNNAFLVKRKQAGGVQFSKDPLNLTNKHSRKYSSLANPSAIGLSAGKDGKIVLTTKLGRNANKPAKAFQKTEFKSTTSGRKVYRSVINSTHQKGYRPDLSAEAVQRATALKLAAKEKKAQPESKPRGKKALKASESA
ncbi:ribosomal L28e protein family-domain-containing protein [Delphinella strobiligena]|nr:ribosomal L28e protein family-domain-containing protein [Delphinella strobiligena]